MRRSASKIINDLEQRIARLERQAFNFKDVKDFFSQRWVKDSFGLTEKDVIRAAESANFIKGFKGRPKILKAVQIKSEQGLYELLIDKGQKKEICYDDLCEETGMVDEHFLAYIYFSSPDAKPVGVEVGSVDGKHDRKKVVRHLKSLRSTRTAGRRYDDEDWVFFIHNEHDLASEIDSEEEAEKLREKFEDCIERLCDKNRLSICDDDGLSRVAFLAFASIVGHGTGLWDHDHPEADTLENLVKRDRKCGDLAEKIDNLPYDLGLA